MNNNNNSRYTFGIGHARTCPHNVKGLSEGKRVIKRRVKKAIAIDQRKPSDLLVAMSLEWTSRPFPIL